MNVAEHCRPEHRQLIDERIYVIDADPQSVAANADDMAERRGIHTENGGAADHTLASDQPDFDRVTLICRRQDGDQTFFNEIEMLDGKFGVLDNTSRNQRYGFEKRPQSFQVLPG